MLNYEKIGLKIASRRRELRLSQSELGTQVFDNENLTRFAAQTRISRIERGDLVSVNRKTMTKILSILDMDQAIAENQQRGHLQKVDLHQGLIDAVPELIHYFGLINIAYEKGNAEEVLRHFQAMCEIVQSNRKKLFSEKDRIDPLDNSADR